MSGTAMTQSRCYVWMSDSRPSSRIPRHERWRQGRVGVPSKRRVFTEGSESEKEPGKLTGTNFGGITEFVAETLLPTRQGLFRLRGYRHTVPIHFPPPRVTAVTF